jgi:hypothetical protein
MNIKERLDSISLNFIRAMVKLRSYIPCQDSQFHSNLYNYSVLVSHCLWVQRKHYNLDASYIFK